MSTLNEFGFADLGLRAADFTETDQIIQLGRAPNRIDLLTGISGVGTDKAFATKITAELDKLPVAFLSKPLLIATNGPSLARKTWLILKSWD